MKKIGSKVVSVLLVLVLICGLLPTPVLAVSIDGALKESDETQQLTPAPEQSPAEELEVAGGSISVPEAPVFVIDLEGTMHYTQGEIAEALSVEAVSNDGGIIAFQWHSSDADDFSAAKQIPGEVGQTLVPNTEQVGVTYYFVTAINTLEGRSSVPTVSKSATVIVEERPQESDPTDNAEVEPAPDTTPEPLVTTPNAVSDEGEGESKPDEPAVPNIMDIRQANLNYYKYNTLQAPLWALSVYALTLSAQETGSIPATTLFDGNLDAYYGRNNTFGSAEALAAIDTMVRDENPREYYKVVSGGQSSSTSDLIDEILSHLQENGKFEWSAPSTQSQNYEHLSSTYSLLALEMYFGGQNWYRTGGNEKQSRIGAIETYLESFNDATYNGSSSWSVSGGRMIGQPLMARTLGNYLYAQADAAQLLARWLDDNTLISVNGSRSALKDVAKKELDGVMNTLIAIFNNKPTTGNFGSGVSAMPTKIINQKNLPHFISALIASDRSSEVGLSELIQQLIAFFEEQDAINGDPLMAYPAGAIANNSSVWAGPVAFGDYIHGTAVLSTFKYTPPSISDEDALAFDLDKLDLPSSTTSDLTLLGSGMYGSTITWTSSDAQAIDPATGAVKLPDAGQPTKVVILTATVTKGSCQKIKTFSVSLMSQSTASVKGAVNLDASALKIHLFTTSSLTLPTSGANGSTITWASSNTAVISDSGVVICGTEEQKVTMTATISKSSDTETASETRIFEVTVGVKPNDSDIVAKLVNDIRESYQDNRNLTGSYWDVWMAKSILRDDFDQYNFTFYNLKQHKAGREWAGTDIGAAILQIVAQGDNPYDYQGVNYVQRLINYITPSDKRPAGSGYKYFWGTFTEPIFLVLGLEAAGAMTPEYAEGLKRCSGMMRSIGQGADYGGWAMAAVSNYVINHPASRETYAADFATLNRICLEALVKDSTHEQYGFIGGDPYAGYSAAVGSNSVLIGSVGAKKAGFTNWDFNSADWTVGEKSLQTRIYEHFFTGSVGADGNFKTQPGIAFGDLYHGSNVWTSENPTTAKLSALLQEAQGKLNNKDAYTKESFDALKAAYTNAEAVKNQEFNFGQQYFALKDALKNLKDAGSTTVTVLGSTDPILNAASVSVNNGTYFEILQTAAAMYGKDFDAVTASGITSITRFGGLTASGNGAWCLYDGGKSVANLNDKPKDGAVLTLKYCANGSSGNTLQEQLVYEAKQALDLGDTTSVTSDLSLPNSGLNGTSIVWSTDKPLSLTSAGKVTQGRYDVRVILTATINGSDGETSAKKEFTVIVKGSNAAVAQQYAYISVVDPKGKTYLTKTKVEIEPGDTAYTVLKKTNLFLDVDEHSEYGVYVRAIEGWGEFSDGNKSGWMYRVTHNGKTSFPGRSAALEPVEDGDYVEWLFTRNLGEDLGNKWDEGTTKSETVTLTPTVTADRYGVAKVAPTYYELLELIENAIDAGASSVVIAPKVRGGASEITITIPTNAASSLVFQTDTDLTLDTSVGNVTIPNSALSAIVQSARGSDINFVIAERDPAYAAGLLQGSTQKYTEEQLNSSVAIQVSIESAGRSIATFNGRSITLYLPVNGTNFKSGVWYDILHISDGTSYSTERLNGKCFRENGQLYVPITTTHLSTFVILSENKATTVPDTDTIPFRDVNTADWFYNDVAYVYQKGLFNGDSPTTFAPYGSMNRAMLVTVLHRYEGQPAARASGFTDVASGQWYTNGVSWASNMGVVNGKGNNKFDPYGNITREEIATILYRYAKIKGWDVTASANLYSFNDGARTSDWATRAMQWAYAKGIINGKGGGTLDPGGYATRAEVAAMMRRFIEAY